VSRVASTHDDGGLHVDTDSGGHGVEVLDHGEVDPSKLKGGVESGTGRRGDDADQCHALLVERLTWYHRHCSGSRLGRYRPNAMYLW
jgi:hypothetical protein